MSSTRVLAGVRRRHGELRSLAIDLVRIPSTLGNEQAAQGLVAERLRSAGFDVELVAPTPEDLAEPLSGYPLVSYEGRSSVVGRVGNGKGRSLHLSGHIDVVPVESPARWSLDPWGGITRNGRIWGRGAGDMKGGLAAYLIAVESVLDTLGPPKGELIFSSVLEEECGGNGMLSVLRSGHVAEALLIGEPTGLTLDHGGVGVIWARLSSHDMGGHAATPRRASTGPIDEVAVAIRALRSLEDQLNAPVPGDPFLTNFERPYRLNFGAIHGGVWPSSEPSEVALDVRVRFGPSYSPETVQTLVRDALAGAKCELALEFTGFRAPAYNHSPRTKFGRALDSAHSQVGLGRLVHRISTATTDARWSSPQSYCYGPLAGRIHGVDEWVDIESLERTSEAVASLVAEWCWPASAS